MAGGPYRIKEEMETSMAEELVPGSCVQSQEHLVIAEMKEHGSQPLGASHWRQKLDSKAADSGSGQPVWNKTATRAKKMGPQVSIPRVLKEPDHGDANPREYPGGFQSRRFHYERNPEADMVAEIGLEELNELEMEVMRRQLQVITCRLQALEEQGATWRHRETLFFTMLVSACVVNLWLWMRQ
ncbi:fetal and adult testis-expressed transcript protein [Acinonyx jubatus]|uniref:Fetal and adult testis-expressed transcript protein n=2 Tax=Felinae TaxID=338152 RepID=A0A6J0AB56_ACIJB|nr:fetal and adult testis-expressed transcript protein [Acinonyx jubatus]XP_025789842.1 fetal and adult testis-expressed transcript protein [Puma concolor]